MLEMESAKFRSQCALRAPHAQSAYVPYMSFNLRSHVKTKGQIIFFC